MGKKGETAKGKEKLRGWSFLLNGRGKLSGYCLCSPTCLLFYLCPSGAPTPVISAISSGVGFPDDSVPFTSLLRFGAVCTHAFPPVDPE